VATIVLPGVSSPRLWKTAQTVGVLLTLVLLAALVTSPRQSLHLLWDMVIPILPATFLINPLIWRNVCPLGTLNAYTGKRIGTRSIPVSLLNWAWGVGLVLLAVLVPARRFVFNTNGALLAVTIAVVATLALAGGFLFAGRAGFCNALCPVLPVEKLYGQAPLVTLGNARCPTCEVCTSAGCIDLAFTKSVAQTLGPSRRGLGWLLTPFGVFVAAFPGFIYGYFTLANADLAAAGAVYAHVAISSIVSYAIVAAVVGLSRMPSRTVVHILGGASIAVYYWFAAPTLGAAYGAPVLGPPLVRLAAFSLVAVWMWRLVGREYAT